MMKVHVNPEICAGFGICLGIAPDVFELHDDGYAVVLASDVGPEDEDIMRRAADQCPSRAIWLSEDASAPRRLTGSGSNDAAVNCPRPSP